MNWDLSELFQNEEKFELAIENTRTKASEFEAKFRGNLANLTCDEFCEALGEYERINAQISKIMSFVHLDFARDTTRGARQAKVEQICNDIAQNLLFFELEFNELSEERAQNFIAGSGRFAYYLNLLKKHKSHQLSLLEEKVLLKTSVVGAEAFSRLFDESMARLKFDFGGEKISEEELLSHLYDSDRNARKQAAASLSAVLEQNSHLLTYIYNMIKTSLKISCELRGYGQGELIMHEENQIEKSSVDALISATERNFDLVWRYYDKKREILGLEKLYDFDRYAPLNLNDDSKFSFDEAKQIVLDAFDKFSPKFGQIAREAFAKNWIDAMPKPNKQSGAFSHSGSADTHPFVLLNFTAKRRDVFTLAHELGHAIHQYLSYNAGYFYSFTPLTTAETASVFCEMLVFDYMLSRSDKSVARAMIANKLEDIFATLYRQIGFTTFERRIHATPDELTTEQINEIWLEESKKMFGDALELRNEYKIWWSYIPHFIHTPFYCYSYGFAQLLVLALYGLYKSGKISNFAEIYTEFLSSGGSDSPKNLVAKFGLNLDDDKFWEIGISQIRSLVDEFVKE
ncbi:MULTISPECIES: M3 family oligoendopeptidase [unclassified Campylobacter]|uniref:M3 family oligoendopeptidase n=1 Tax=unclassified Campylobacter TaxID=2593542 RepID=UPI0022E9DC4F|nr:MULTISPECIES: M3 family oligoendopeptidase [unclassified Campylobacter]MDA3043507.1 M3 family oligoendopeptidase [Campylobacter sp. JMF_09 ED2]MDA3063407.1 M3 family oligoendopeptidase [Campylobacter sp. JMF_11 EL3]MDA3071447.1 M3 family oligoendopeptidase [Campylobacter sp. VBCF_03 NA9]MDA3074489.1 M3 family oligoendopeptidase [Campylobacter sp. JMF_05 ED3]